MVITQKLVLSMVVVTLTTEFERTLWPFFFNGLTLIFANTSSDSKEFKGLRTKARRRLGKSNYSQGT
jgi:hypothetical protein